MEVGGGHQVRKMAGYTGFTSRQMGVVTFKRLQWRKLTVKCKNRSFVVRHLLFHI